MIFPSRVSLSIFGKVSEPDKDGSGLYEIPYVEGKHKLDCLSPVNIDIVQRASATPDILLHTRIHAHSFSFVIRNTLCGVVFLCETRRVTLSADQGDEVRIQRHP